MHRIGEYYIPTSAHWLPLRKQRGGICINNILFHKLSEANMTKYYTYLISALNTEVSYTNLILYFLILSIQKLK